MLIDFFCELMTLSWLGVLILLPAAAINKRADTPPPNSVERKFVPNPTGDRRSISVVWRSIQP